MKHPLPRKTEILLALIGIILAAVLASPTLFHTAGDKASTTITIKK